MFPLLIAVTIGAAGRASLWFIDDDLARPLRDAWIVFWIRRLGPQHPLNHPQTGALAKFVTCIRCVGFWITLFVVILAWQFGQSLWYLVPAAALTVNMAWIIVFRLLGWGR